ncbi:hypothetical protein OPU71_13415 [Niveibacterium sp. 24ML]|nr:hypothetical protein [Niveibacterium sp. 24ML]
MRPPADGVFNLRGGHQRCAGAIVFYAAREMAGIYERPNRNADAARMRGHSAKILKTVERVTWDDAWYPRTAAADGSHTNTEGKIYTHSQSWTVIAGFAESERAQTALDSVHSHLATANGLKLSAPASTVTTRNWAACRTTRRAPRNTAASSCTSTCR